MILIMVAGCASTVGAVQDDPIFMFNREYYAVKDLTVEDIWKLKEINISDNKGAAKAAGLILGRYYVRKGDIGKGDQYLKDNLDDSYLDKYMKVNGHIWAYDAASKSGDMDRANKERDYLKKIDMDDKTEKAFKVYCSQENINYGSDPKVCINGADSKKEIIIPIESTLVTEPSEPVQAAPKTENIAKAEEPKQEVKAEEKAAPEKPVAAASITAAAPMTFPVITAPDADMLQPSTLPEASPKIAQKPEKAAETQKAAEPKVEAPATAGSADTVIDLDKPDKTQQTPKIKTENTGRKVAVVNIQNSVKNPEIVEAMLYTISKLKVNIDLDFEGAKPVYDYVLDAATDSITQGSETVDFSFDKKAQMRAAARIMIQSGGRTVAIGYADGLRDTAEEIADEFGGKAKFYLFNMEDRNFQTKLQEIKGKAGNSIVSYILAGTQEQALKVVPFLKYYSPRPDKTIIVAAINNLTRKFYTGDYADYTYNAIVVSDTMTAGNADAEKFISDFTKDFGKSPAVSDLIGYDMLLYMEKKRNPSFSAGYLTGITKVANGQVYRAIGAYRIVGGGKLRKFDY